MRQYPIPWSKADLQRLTITEGHHQFTMIVEYITRRAKGVNRLCP